MQRQQTARIVQDTGLVWTRVVSVKLAFLANHVSSKHVLVKTGDALKKEIAMELLEFVNV
jgi:hypothetical protein